jgi:methionyl-tRNA synthetase
LSKFYLTTPIYYVNDVPHIGHIYTTVVADTVARFRRMLGDDVRFLTGSDEHGQKIEKAAKAQGIAPIALADRVVARYHELWPKLEITNDDFIRTTEPRHRRGVEEMVRRLREKGDLYLASHAGWYCTGCETFYPEKDLLDGKLCPDHRTPALWQEEENWFFRLSAYGDRLLEHYERNPGFIRPESRRNEVISFVRSGLRDLSVSRTGISWGIPFPDSPGHVVYVWLDALSNYATAVGFGGDDSAAFGKWWPADVHLLGKDILRFHAVYWPAFLMSAGLPLPGAIWAHGWWERDGQKMSKSVGNVVRPDHLLEEFGPDPLRWFLLREMAFGQDASFSDEAFLARFNADLANGLGNTFSRAFRMTSDAFGGKTPPIVCNDNPVRTKAIAVVAEWKKAMEEFRFHEAAAVAWSLLGEIDSYIVAREPWKLAKKEDARDSLSRILWNCLEGLRLVALMAAPAMPGTSREVLRRLGAGEGAPSVVDLEWGGLAPGAPLVDGPPLFPRVDTKKWLEEARASLANATKPSKESPVTEEKTPEIPAAPAAPPAPAPAPKPAPAEPEAAAEVTIDEFFRTDLRIAEIVAAENVPKSNKLLRLTVKIGEETRQVVAGIAKAYTPEQMTGKKVVVVANLKAAKLMGLESRGMVLAASQDGVPTVIFVDPAVPSGTKVR